MESEIQRAICDYLALRKVFFFRCNNIPAVYINNAGHRQFRKLSKYTPRGVADILAVKDGHAIFVEVKAENGRMSEEQHEFARKVVLAGGTYLVAKSIDDLRRNGL